MSRCTRYNIIWSSFSVPCSRYVVFSGYSGFLHQLKWPPWYKWYIAEGGVRHYNSNPQIIHISTDYSTEIQGKCIPFQEDVLLSRKMYSFPGRCIPFHDDVLLSRTMYSFIFVFVCFLFVYLFLLLDVQLRHNLTECKAIFYL